VILGRSGPPGRIALVHRDPARAEETARLLRPAGHRVQVVVEGPDVVRSIVEGVPDLLIGSGSLVNPPLASVVRGVRRSLGEIPVVVLMDGEPGDSLIEADEIVREPALPGELNLRVATLLRVHDEQRALRRQLRETEGLNRISWAFGLESGPEELHGQLSRQSAEMLDAEIALILTYNAARREMRGEQRAFGLTAAQVASVKYSVHPEPRSRWNFRTNGALVSNDADGDPRLVRRVVEALNLRSVAAVPLTQGPRVLGVLLVANRRHGRRFEDGDLQLLRRVAAEATVGVDNLRLHEELKTANALLQEYDRLKSEFVAVVAHDFRRPLMSIRGFAELILEEPDLPLETRQEYMHTVMAETDGLARLADDTLLITRIETGEFEFQWREVDLAPFILDCMPLGLSDHSLLAEVPPHLPSIVTDPDRLRQVLTNLVSNAVKYSPGGGSITVRCQPEPAGFVTIEVRDRGLGIPEDQIARLFQKFARVRGEAHMRVTGTGLGLYICRLIVEGMGGRVWAESTPGEGSTFAFSVPTDGRAARAARAQAEAAETA
jgi:signal transduction histidine kinase